MNLRNPALEFGPPTTFVGAVMRLPDDSHPAIKTDPEIQHLSKLRETLEATTFRNWVTLNDRMVPFTRADMAFMERWSFRRRQPALERSRSDTLVRASTFWSQIYAQDRYDQYYAKWQIHSLMPDFDVRKYKLISIECLETEREEFPFNVGPVTPDELKKLLQELRRP